MKLWVELQNRISTPQYSHRNSGRVFFYFAGVRAGTFLLPFSAQFFTTRMLQKYFSPILFQLLLLPVFAFSQKGILSGKATDVTTNEPLIGVTISVEKNNGTASDGEGNYK